MQRYEVIQKFVRGSRQFGSQRRASEKLAAKIGLENLARTAGFPDPLRLTWAMEAHAVADLAIGPVSVTQDQEGVDPEASASTVEMRAALIRETCAMAFSTSFKDVVRDNGL